MRGWGAPAALAATLGALLAGAGPAPAQEILHVRRGDIHITVRVRGTVVTRNVTTLTSTIPGRIEDVNFESTGAWEVNGTPPLGTVASERLAALLDSPTTTDRSVVIARWNSVFPLIPIRCPSDCYLLKIQARPRTWISPGDALFTAAQLLMRGQVSPGGARLIRDGQWLTYWAAAEPKRKFRVRVENFSLDRPGEPQDSAGSFSMAMTPERFLPPGTAWDGVIIPVDHPHALLVPTVSLLDFGGQVFLPVQISTGITTADWTEIAAGARNDEAYLLLNNAQLGKALRHRIEHPAAASGAAAAPSQSAPAQAPAPAPRQEQEPDYGGDLYGQ